MTLGLMRTTRSAARDWSIWLAGIVLGVVLGSPQSARATITLSSVADATASEPSATSNFGTATTLDVKYQSANTNDRKSYIRFSLSSVTQTIDAASVTFTLPSGTGGARTYTLYGLKDNATGNSWSETGITWNNAPANDTADGGTFTSDALLLSTVAFGAGGVTTVTFTDVAIKNFLNADTDDLVTFMLYRTNSNTTVDSFNSREAASGGPLLALEVPEPAALSFAGVGAVGLLARRKRRLAAL